MALIDIILAIPIIYFVVRGWRNGVLREAATLVGILLGIWASVHLSQQVADMLELDVEENILVIFFVCFVGAMVVCYFIGRMAEKMMKASHLSIINHTVGAALGLAKAVCILSVVISGIVYVDKNEVVLTAETKEQSKLYKPVYNTGERLTSSIKEYIDLHGEEWKEKIQQV